MSKELTQANEATLRTEVADDEGGLSWFHIGVVRETLASLDASRAREAKLVEALRSAAATIGAVYDWLERVEKAGGATSISGVAACHAMLKSLRKQAPRVESLVMAPARAALSPYDTPAEMPSDVHPQEG
jgi:hypothetical protein